MKFCNKIKDYLNAVKNGDGTLFIKLFLKHLLHGLRITVRHFYHEYESLHFTRAVPEREYKMISGLHQLIAATSFSVVITVKTPKGPQLTDLLKSVYKQTSPDFEVIIEAPAEVKESLEDVLRLFPQVKFNTAPEKGWVLHLSQNEWVRADFLYRYEQLIKTIPHRKTILYTAPVELDRKKRLVPGTLNNTPPKLNFPYEFLDVKLYGVCFESSMWNTYKEAGYDVKVLEAVGYTFQPVPLPLLAHTKSEPEVNNSFVSEFTRYVKLKGLKWDIEEGLLPGSVRAKPRFSTTPHIQVVIPYKDSRELTLAAVRSVKASIGVKVHITLIDNRSANKAIAIELESMGCEVIQVDEPFNYSRLNNLGVEKTAFPMPYVLLLNNDAELDPHALYEMASWLDQPEIGIVGCRLHYPNGMLQHGGVQIDGFCSRPGAVQWVHPGMTLPLEKTIKGRLIYVPDAVTGAAAMMTRNLYQEIGGFDEDLFPVAYSDTNLAIKIKQKGLKPLYTPYAYGVHHESLSRVHGTLEDFDRSIFLHDYFDNIYPATGKVCS